MNILFFSRSEVSSQKGGTERITTTISNGLKCDFEYNCYSAFLYIAVPNRSLTQFDDKLHINRTNIVSQVRDFVLTYSIDCIVMQGEFTLVSQICKAVKDIPGCKIVFTHHYSPGFEQMSFSFQDTIRVLLCGGRVERIASLKRLILFPYLLVQAANTPRFYRQMYNMVDKVVLLSEKFIPAFVRYAGLSDSDKFFVIPNALSYSDTLAPLDCLNKEKIVLIVSRLEETPKKISYALTIWKILKKHSEAFDWKLKIIGHGPFKKRYEKQVLKQNIPDVEFCGVRDPKEDYKIASLLMMTSYSEGWGLTLTEAQQMGCVPLAFDSYLSLHDIIEDGYNGRIIPYEQFDEYASAMLDLMSHDDDRMMMAHHAIVSSQQFEIHKVVKKWNELFKSVAIFR